MQKILLIDNYDSFTYNLLHYINVFPDVHVDVYRNDQIDINLANEYDSLVLSPGPGLPCDAGLMPELIKRYYSEKKILGVCLGMQAIYEFAGGKLRNLEQVLHGISKPVIVNHIHDDIFKSIPQQFMAGRYHSWVADNRLVPPTVEVTATDDDGEIMAIKLNSIPVYGVQFHPESVMTPFGMKLIENWISI